MLDKKIKHNTPSQEWQAITNKVPVNLRTNFPEELKTGGSDALNGRLNAAVAVDESRVLASAAYQEKPIAPHLTFPYSDNPYLLNKEIPEFSEWLTNPSELSKAIAPAMNAVVRKASELLEEGLREGDAKQTLTAFSQAMDLFSMLESRISIADLLIMNSQNGKDQFIKAKEQSVDIKNAFIFDKFYTQKNYDKLTALEASLESLDPEWKQYHADLLKQFQLNGFSLPESAKTRFKELNSEITKLEGRYEDKVGSFRDAFTMSIKSEKELDGLTSEMKAKALVGNNEFIFNVGNYLDLITNAKNGELRKQAFVAFNKAGSDPEDPDSNFTRLAKLRGLRQEKAKLLSYANFAEMQTDNNRIAPNAKLILEANKELLGKLEPCAKHEYNELLKFAKDKKWISNDAELIAPWDFKYFMSQYKKEKFKIDPQELNQYFDFKNSWYTMLNIMRETYGVRFKQLPNDNVWHSDVEFYEVSDANDKPMGTFYLDPYYRPGKRPGAFVSELNIQSQYPGEAERLPSYLLVLNAPNPKQKGEANPVDYKQEIASSMAHELGHILQAMCIKSQLPEMNFYRYPKDLIELASQYNEHELARPENVQRMSYHCLTKGELSLEAIEQVQKMSEFGQALDLYCRTQDTIFDQELHQDSAAGKSIHDIYLETHSGLGVYPDMPEGLPAHLALHARRGFRDFTHWGSSHYAAAYSDYATSEAMAGDVMKYTESVGKQDADARRKFLQERYLPFLAKAEDAQKMLENSKDLLAGQEYKFGLLSLVEPFKHYLIRP